ncbi:MAG: DNA-directed RNA polymerase subunit beta [Candidatus Bipolaricaulota bacterium]|nr:DNA-directed RNA polymerase subunit beta [Candidatus Bipolaricaulota bacterium]
MEYRERRSYGRIQEILRPPYLLADVRRSFSEFVEKGIARAFADVTPIEGHGKDGLVMEFVDPYLGDPRNTEAECKDKDLTYSQPLRVTVRLLQEGKLLQETELYIGDFPMMTNRGTFIINGSENALVNELTRAPGVYFTQEDANQYKGHILPELGAWLEIILDTKRGTLRANLDRKGKVVATVLLKALGLDDERISRFFSFPVAPASVENLEPYVGYRVAMDVSGKDGKPILAAGETLQKASLGVLEKAGIREVHLVHRYIQRALEEDQTTSQEDALRSVYRKLRPSDRSSPAQMGEYVENLYFHPTSYHLSQVGRFKVNRKLGMQLKQPVLYLADIVRTLKVLVEVPTHPELLDEKDHLANKRVRLPGELAENALRTGLVRMARIARDKLSKYALEEKDTIRRLISTRTVQGSINQLFYTGRFSQFLEQTNPLTELTHKRRLNALGGGLTKRRAKIEVRDVHSSHYARICPIETPEGQNIGLITSLACYASVNEYGFLVSPYRKVVKGKVTDQIDYLMADDEEHLLIAPATAAVASNGRLLGERVEVRTGREDVRLVPPAQVNYIGVSPRALVGISAALIPFLEHDDSNRALMGANMQRQAVPLLRPEAPLVGTGLERQAAMDSGMLLLAEEDGTVAEVDADHIVVKKGKKRRVYPLVSFERSNQDTILHQRPVVSEGDEVTEGDLLADGPSSDLGELALGRNLLVAIMPFEGYNYEDAIVVSDRLVRENLLDSIHIEEFEVKAEETKLGPEEITSDIPNISKEDLKNLDEDGIVREGTVVRTGDILVGKITPRGESEPTPEEKIFRSIFGERARNVRNTSLRMRPVSGTAKVIKVKKFSRDNGDELDAGVNELVKVFVAQRKVLSIGDKLAGRHGNKGVISTVRSMAEMPFLPDGTPVDVVLNPMGVPSRMNLGQIFEANLGWLAHLRHEVVASPIFDGAHEDEILEALRKEREKVGLADGDDHDGKVTLRDGRTGEAFARPITVGYMLILKLEHIADEKIHARSTGPYALITQQPLGGKAQFGGQRLGEMEVWALEAYGASALLQEMLTLKSDDTRGRIQLYKAILKGEEFPKPGLPESFKVLLRELRSLGLYPRIYDRNDHEVDIS